LQKKTPENQGLSIYRLALQAYLSSLAKGDSYYAFNSTTLESSFTKVLLYKDKLINNTIPIEPKSYKEAHNTLYSDM
jgi:hypothetical protein